MGTESSSFGPGSTDSGTRPSPASRRRPRRKEKHHERNALVIEAVRKTITVDCVVEEAFRVFTTDMISWWPTDSHSIHGNGVKEILFEERESGEVYEVTAEGKKGYWGSVLSWEPPTRVVLAWNILEREAVPTEVDVRFTAEGEKTRVDLEHRGWEAVEEDGSAKRDNYDTGWDHVLGLYEARLG